MHQSARKAQAALVGVLIIGLALVGCGPASTTAPTSSPTATEDAIEVAIRDAKAATVAYAEAISAVRLDAPATLQALYDLTTAEQRENEEELYEQMKDKGWSIDGAVQITVLEAQRESATVDSVTVSICLDVEDYHFFDESGVERIPPRESTMQSVDVHLVKIDSWLVEDLTHRDGEPKCS